MAANISPIFTRTPHIQVGAAVLGSAANTATDGTGANSFLVFTADATEGSFVHKIVLKPVSTIAATIVRAFVCTDTGAFTPGTTNTAANSAMVAELSTAAFTASNTAASPQYEIPLNLPLNASFKIFLTFGTSTGAGTTGFSVSTVGGKY